MDSQTDNPDLKPTSEPNPNLVEAESPNNNDPVTYEYKSQDKNDDNKLVQEFERMINQDEKLREFAEKSLGQAKPRPDSNSNATNTDLESIIDTRILDMLRMLEEYRRKCIKEDDDYIEARRAESKFEKTLLKATKKQRTQIYNFQEKELKNIEITQKQQYQEF